MYALSTSWSYLQFDNLTNSPVWLHAFTLYWLRDYSFKLCWLLAGHTHYSQNSLWFSEAKLRYWSYLYQICVGVGLLSNGPNELKPCRYISIIYQQCIIDCNQDKFLRKHKVLTFLLQAQKILAIFILNLSLKIIENYSFKITEALDRCVHICRDILISGSQSANDIRHLAGTTGIYSSTGI